MNVADYSERFQQVVLFYQEVVVLGNTESEILSSANKVHFSTRPVFGVPGLYLKSLATKIPQVS